MTPVIRMSITMATEINNRMIVAVGVMHRGVTTLNRVMAGYVINTWIYGSLVLLKVEVELFLY